MTPLEKLKDLEAKASQAPWGTDEDGVTCPPDRPDQAPFYVEFEGAEDVDSQLVAALRNLAPEMIALWAAADSAEADSQSEMLGHCTQLSPDFHDAIAALNAKAAEVLK